MFHEQEEHLRTAFAMICVISVFVDFMNLGCTTVPNILAEFRLNLESLEAEVDHLLLALYPFVNIHSHTRFIRPMALLPCSGGKSVK